MTPTFIESLLSIQRTLFRRRICALVLAIVTSISAILILTGMYSRMNGLQEMNAFIITTGTLLLGAIGTALGIVRLRRLQPQLKELAEQTESARPELLDSLNTAVAMHLAAEATTGHSTNRFQNALFAKVTADTAVLPWKSLLIPTYLRWASILSLLLVTGILVAVAMRSDTLAKSAFAFADWRADSTSGMTLKPAPMQAALGSDLTVRAQIHRWEQRAWIRIHTAEGQETHVMPINRNGEATFTFYDVRAELRFEVWTPSLRSTRQTVTVFAPPFLDGVKIEVEPPAYTRMPAQVIDGLQDFSAPWGSRLRISADTRHAASAEWIFNQDRVLFSPGSGAQSWILDWQARRTGNFMVLLSNEYEQRESRTHRLTVIPDEPPVVEILHPGRDIQLAPDAIVAFLFYFADDYGLSEATLNVSVAGRMQHSFPMRLQPDADGFAPRELQMPFGMELESLEAEDGDLLSYWVQVADNREPVPQFSRSEVFFIEVRAEREPEEIDGMPMDQERLTLRPQIEELKRLLRLSHRTVTRDGEQRLAGNQQLTSALLELRQSIDEVYERIKPTLEEANDQFFTRGFESALALVDNARDLITADQTEIAIPVQEQALQELLALENALVVEQISREPSEGDGEGEGEGEQGEGEQGQQENPLMALSEALEQLRELQRRQDNQNTSTDRAGRTGADSSQLEQLAQTQDALRRDLGALDRDLSRIPDAAEARGSLLQAEQRMRGAASGLRTDDTGRGWREGTRAAEQLETAGRLLQDIIDSALNEGLAGLQAEAQQLAQAQQQAAAASAAADSEGASSADVDDLLQQQDQLNERLEQLLQNMEGLGQSMQSNNPGSAQALTRAARQSRSGNPGSAMTRAANALLYEFLSEAADLQSEAAEGLQRLSEAIAEAGSQMPGLSARQLERMQQELQRDQGTLSGLGEAAGADAEQQLQDIRGQWEQRLRRLSQQTGDRQLQGLADALGMNPTSTDAQLRETQHLLERADGIIDAYRQLMQRRQVLDLRRRSAPPPERFREQVESYFRQLAEE